MKNLKFFLAVVLCIGAISTASAQLTTGQPTSSTIRTGNRPGAGSYGIYFGATSNLFRDMANADIKVASLPLINFKYMNTDDVEWRLGVEIYKSTETLKGKTEKSEEESAKSFKNKSKESKAALYPGIAYHFSKNNILDVYVGAELPLGWDTYKTVRNNGVTKTDISYQKNAFFVGLGGFVGLQAFIADLPLAIGFEYGISSRFDLGLKYKSVVTSDGKTQTVYMPDASQFKELGVSDDDVYSKLSARKGEVGGQFRLTLSYYFK